jgi:GntR family transcriptional regulator, transcriptional repressor for pyruvate dehydrogenase complex
MSVADLAIQRIRELIVSGRLEPGQRLPSEPKLAAELGLSRSSLREAIRSLAQARVLDVRRGDGTYVSSLEPDHLLGDLNFALDLMQDTTLLEAFEVRRLLEPAATGLAARRITDDQLAELRESLDAMRKAQEVEELITLDCDFHNKIVSYTGNAMLGCLVEAVAGRSIRARIWRGLAEGGVHVFTLEQHGQIVNALAARDSGLAAAASALHVSASEEWLRTAIERSQHADPDDHLLVSAKAAGVDLEKLGRAWRGREVLPAKS